MRICLILEGASLIYQSYTNIDLERELKSNFTMTYPLPPPACLVDLFTTYLPVFLGHTI